jgi:tetratricopeptide (TPR) repeat protein
MAELANERAVIKKLLDEAEVDAWVFEEDAGARPKTIQETYLEEVEDADIYVGIFWKGYGSYTIEEYERARELGKPCFIYEKRTKLEKRDPELQNFLDQISKVETGLTIYWFETAEELGRQAKEDVAGWLVEIARKGDQKDHQIEIPPRAEYFTGREKQIEKLIDALKPGKVVSITGPGGVGKTSVVSEALYRMTVDGTELPAAFPDGVITYSFYGRPDVNQAFEHIANYYGAELEYSPQETARRVLVGKKAVLVLDGTEEANNLNALLSVCSSCGVVITSRSRGDIHGTWNEMPVFSVIEASESLSAWGRDCIDQPEAMERICELVGRLPLAVRLAGKYLIEHGAYASEYLEWLESTPLSTLDMGKRRHESVPVLLDKSLMQVSDSAKAALDVCGLLALAPFDVELAMAGMGEAKRPVQLALGELVQFGLLGREEKGYVVSHALVHTYARRRMRELEEPRERLIEYYDRFVREESEKGASGYQEINKKKAHIMAMLRQLSTVEQWEGIERLSWKIDDYFDLTGQWAERIETCELGLSAAKGTKDRRSEGSWLGNLGNAYRALGQVEKAIGYYEQALEIAREIGDRRGEGNRLGSLGIAYSALGQVEKAIAYQEQALEISREIGDRRNEGVWLGNLGIAYRTLGQVEKAIVYHEQALEIAREIGDRQSEGVWLGNLGIAYSNLGQVEKAKEYYKQALMIFEEIKSPYRESALKALAELEKSDEP